MAHPLPAGLSDAYWSTWVQTARTVSESLDDGEAWIGGWDGVGLYEGNNKVDAYQSLAVHITTHRLLLVPTSPSPSLPSSSTVTPRCLQARLEHVRQTEFYNGFMRSSPKITLFLGGPVNASDSELVAEASTATAAGEGADIPAVRTPATSWTCSVCGYVNSPAVACKLCGVSRAISASLPPSRAATPASSMPRHVAPAPSHAADGGSASRSPSAPASPAPPADAEGRVACPACTFLNHPSLRECEICSTALPRPAAAPSGETTGSETARRPRPTFLPAPVKQDIVRLSFRRGGEKEAYRRLKNVLMQKAWEKKEVRREQAGAGIDGIMKTMTLGAQAQDAHMRTAFDDLDALMVRAGDMVRLAQSLSARLQSTTPEADASLIHSSLVQLGLPAPAITPDMARDEREYHDGLARELGALLTGDASGRAAGQGASGRGKKSEGLMVGDKGRGVIGLDEVWGLWMRARGVALLAPSMLLAVVPHLAAHTSPPIALLVLPSSLKVLHTPQYAPQALLGRIMARLEPDVALPDSAETATRASADEAAPDMSTTPFAPAEKSLSIVEIAAHEGLAVALAKELVESLETDTRRAAAGGPLPGGLARDDQVPGEGTRWYRDLISAWPVDAV